VERNLSAQKCVNGVVFKMIEEHNSDNNADDVLIVRVSPKLHGGNSPKLISLLCINHGLCTLKQTNRWMVMSKAQQQEPEKMEINEDR
jgi:hypothetical protein